MTINSKLDQLGILIPDAPAPAANYVPWVISGNLLYISGQISKDGDDLLTGKLGDVVSVEQGQAAARVCAINIMAQAKAALGDLERVARVVKLGAFVNSTSEFTQQPQVINGASDLIVEVFGEKGKHTRSAVSCPSLPFGVSVEIDAVLEIEQD